MTVKQVLKRFYCVLSNLVFDKEEHCQVDNNQAIN